MLELNFKNNEFNILSDVKTTKDKSKPNKGKYQMNIGITFEPLFPDYDRENICSR